MGRGVQRPGRRNPIRHLLPLPRLQAAEEESGFLGQGLGPFARIVAPTAHAPSGLLFYTSYVKRFLALSLALLLGGEPAAAAVVRVKIAAPRFNAGKTFSTPQYSLASPNFTPSGLPVLTPLIRNGGIAAVVIGRQAEIGKVPGDTRVNTGVHNPSLAQLSDAVGGDKAQAAGAQGQGEGGSKSSEESASESAALFDGTKPLRLVITGPPASGKGTMSKRVAADYGVVHISAGDLLREKAKTDPELAEVMRRGDLVPAAVIIGLMRERLRQDDVREKGFIIDGYPRRSEEAASLKELLKEEGLALDAVISLEVGKRELYKRMRARGRVDDNDTTFKNRLQVYKRETLPAVRVISEGVQVLKPEQKGSSEESNYAALKALIEAMRKGEPVADARAERNLAWLIAGWNFLTIGTYYILAPVRGAFLLNNFGPTVLPWVYMVGAAATGLAVWGYARAAKKLTRKALITSLLLIFTAALGGWWAVGLAASSVPWVSFAYYIFGDLFSIMSVTLLWTYANDRFGPEAAKRRFGLVAAAGPLGAIVGSALTKVLVGVTGVLPLLGASAIIYAGTIGLFLLAERVKYAKPAPTTQTPPEGGILKTIMGTPLLAALALLVLLERLVPDFGNYLYNAAVYAAYPNKEDLVSFGAMYGLVQNVFSLAASLFLTSFILKKLGIGKALMGVPVTIALGLVAFIVSPVLTVAVAFNGLEGLQRYTFFKSAKESTYTVGSKDVVYRFKAFIEMFVYRFARGLAGFILLLLTSATFLGWGAQAVALAGIPFALLWIYAAWRVGREFKKAEAKK